MKNKMNSLIIEGIVFCGSGIMLLSYSLLSYAKAFNKAWAQSPYLFPLLVAVALIGLSVWVMGEGVAALKKTAESAGAEAHEKKRETSGKKLGRVVIALIICGLYYLALSVLRLPQVTIGILSFQYMFSTFEIVTVLFLATMMAFMGMRKPVILTLVPLGTTLFLSIAFRTLLHVLLP